MISDAGCILGEIVVYYAIGADNTRFVSKFKYQDFNRLCSRLSFYGIY